MSDESSESEDSPTTNKKPRRQYVRCSNSILCIFCNQYHQKKREGKCQNICKELPLFVDYIKENDLSENSNIKKMLMTSSSTPQNTTELSLRRIMAFMNERKDDFRLWSSSTDIDLPSERPSIPRVLQIDTGVQQKNNNGVNSSSGSSGSGNNSVMQENHFPPDVQSEINYVP